MQSQESRRGVQPRFVLFKAAGSRFYERSAAGREKATFADPVLTRLFPTRLMSQIEEHR